MFRLLVVLLLLVSVPQAQRSVANRLKDFQEVREKLEALEALAERNRAAEEPSAEVTRELGEALQSDYLFLRQAALKHLAEHQHPATAAELLANELGQARAHLSLFEMDFGPLRRVGWVKRTKGGLEGFLDSVSEHAGRLQDKLDELGRRAFKFNNKQWSRLGKGTSKNLERERKALMKEADELQGQLDRWYDIRDLDGYWIEVNSVAADEDTPGED